MFFFSFLLLSGMRQTPGPALVCGTDSVDVEQVGLVCVGSRPGPSPSEIVWLILVGEFEIGRAAQGRVPGVRELRCGPTAAQETGQETSRRTLPHGQISGKWTCGQVIHLHL